MAGETVTVKKYVVKLSEEGRNRLNEMIHKGKSSAQTPMKARILLKADVSEAGEGWSDSRIIEALETSATTVHRTRRQLAEEGLDAVLTASKGHGPRYRRFSTGRRKRS